ncbi:MAG: MotA/TolQ/ExbB proton channel family protein [Nevskia sp.]|nr:MotA/TolQ/ExbB proton channel family protein [Nevskia sp.]
MKKRIQRILLAVASGCACSLLPPLASAQSGSPAVDAAANANKAARATQTQIDQLDDQTRALLERYRAAVWQAQQLRVYAEQVEPLLATQDAEKAALQNQAREAEGTAKDILPLMLRMVDSLAKFVALDLPFLQGERRDRIDSLKKLMADPATPLAEKYRRILEAYRIEADYGRGFGAERLQLALGSEQKVVDILHLGRVALLYVTPDGGDTGYWDAAAKQWHSLGGDYRAGIREGLRIARETAAPEILALPVPAAKAAAAAHAQLDAPRLALAADQWLVAERGALGLLHAALDLLTASAQAAAPANAQGIDDLLKQIRDSAQSSARIDAEREQRFIKNKNDQQAQLAQAEGDQRAAQAKADGIRARYEAGSKELVALKQQTTGQAGDVSQIYAAVRETAAEYKGIANDSFLSAQYPERLKLLDRLAAPDSTPSERDLEDFWFTLQQEMSENGKVVRFNAQVIGADGQPQQAQVTRIGSFTAFADGKYLLVQGGQLLLPERQTQDTGLARRFESHSNNDVSDWQAIAIDPTRGNLLALEAQRPRLIDRIRQGGIVGYVIILLGVIGVGLAAFQLWYLARVGSGMTRQLRNIDVPSADNPLGRVLSSLRDTDAEHDPEVLETRLSEAVLREVPKLERFQPFLRMVVAAGPLLGLLGTVTGMIITFQVITEVGAGDPKVMAGGISQAMIATVLGLLIAIPILFINSVLTARSRMLVQILDEQSAGLLARRLERFHAE